MAWELIFSPLVNLQSWEDQVWIVGLDAATNYELGQAGGASVGYGVDCWPWFSYCNVNFIPSFFRQRNWLAGRRITRLQPPQSKPPRYYASLNYHTSPHASQNIIKTIWSWLVFKKGLKASRRDLYTTFAHPFESACWSRKSNHADLSLSTLRSSEFMARARTPYISEYGHRIRLIWLVGSYR